MKIVQNTAPRVYACQGVQLLPGTNELTDAQYAALTKNKKVKADFERGLLVDVAAKAPVKTEPKTAPKNG